MIPGISPRHGILALLLAMLAAGLGVCQESAPQPSGEPQEASQAGQEPSQAPTATEVRYPLAVAPAADGTIYVGDLRLPGIWQMKDGQVSLYFAASKQLRTPLYAVRCLAVDPQGQLVAGDSATRQVYRFDESGQPQPIVPFSEKKLGPFGVPMALAFNSKGELFISDREFHCIWKIGADGGEPTKFVELQAPAGICFDKQDRLWVVSMVDNPLRRYGADGQEEILVKDRPFEYPHAVAVDESGAAYVVDGYKRTVWKVTEGSEPEEWFQHERLVNPVDLKLSGDQLLLIDPRAKALFRIQLDATAEVIDLK